MADKTNKRPMLAQLAVASRVARTALSSRLAAEGLYPGQDSLLLLLGERDGLALREVAQALAVRPPTITKTIARMTKEGLVEKRVCTTDARQSFVHLTERGHGVLATVRQARDETERTALRGLKRKERKTLRKLLARVERNFGGAPDAGADDEAP
ncbi:MarR family winged helix-turn-helix transcriptional regulator [Aureimonas pseudogalii]|uniref:DNA-binding MarR family transcriptional regulator n=1 Tax=Aureimonas pseudogalii TaxID=1744844 RepID=A0A7W6H5P9_9HYPH|nr:MarR family transcriptional regulator [Aureimonas pseudogalii]MBB3999026.1 DNA-binding MarR family transcriptional regulator [Aureimonas pseudogalii]